MAHRGRLNVLANVLKKPAQEIFAEFLDRSTNLNDDGGGDVKYHLGYSNERKVGQGRVHLSLGFNPSHLEWANTVVQGRVRAKQDRMDEDKRGRGVPILVHGDSAFAGQGVVAEAFNMSGLDAYHVGGTIHVVVNNQVGFTTSPERSYCTTYATDVARMLQIPIIHINGEDPEALAVAADMAVDFRQRFQRDVVIDMWCYRKLGHNEGDEPSFTQPLMYKVIKRKPSVVNVFLEAFSNISAKAGSEPVNAATAETFVASAKADLNAALDTAKTMKAPVAPSSLHGVWSKYKAGRESSCPDVPTKVSKSLLSEVGRALVTLPSTFTPHPKIAKFLETRAAMLAGVRAFDWGMGEALAYGTLAAENVRTRLIGQDSRRGTFSHRHAVLLDHKTGEEFTPLEHVRDNQGTFEVRDSSLSEAGALGFEYGYSLDMPDGLVIWEAQFGDFVNSAQVIIDQFICSSESKWRRMSGLVMLLPHGMEGQGPEHSSARLERFLNLCVNDNMQVVNVTTPAQFFHVLRRQVHRAYRKPLIVMSPKSLLRHPKAVSKLEDFTEGSFDTIKDDHTVNKSAVKRLVLCSGKFYYDLDAAREKHNLKDVAIVRLEQLSPLRSHELLDVICQYPMGIPLIWAQEEARNMGAWYSIQRRLPPLLAGSFAISGVTRPINSSPATGSASRHKLEHEILIRQALGLPQN